MVDIIIKTWEENMLKLLMFLLFYIFVSHVAKEKYFFRNEVIATLSLTPRMMMTTKSPLDDVSLRRIKIGVLNPGRFFALLFVDILYNISVYKISLRFTPQSAVVLFTITIYQEFFFFFFGVCSA